MADRPNSRVALMAIHPTYANAIVEGTKKVEFRKRALADDITTVLIYATSPVQKVIGEFGIERTVIDRPDALWKSFGDVGKIDQVDFEKYYCDRETGVAFVIAWAKRYGTPHSLLDLESSPAIPQSFAYVSSAEVPQYA